MHHLKTTGEVYSRPVCTNQALIAWMQQQRQQGDSYQAIAATLTADGIPSLRGGQWIATTVRRILCRQACTVSVQVA